MRAFHENKLYRSALPFRASLHHNISFLAHWHTDLEIVYVCEGSIRMGVNSEVRILKKGEAVVCSSGDIHFYDSRDSESLILIIIFHPQLIGSPGGWPKGVRLASPFLGGTDEDNLEEPGKISALIAPLLNRLHQELQDKLPYYDQLITGILYELCGLILRYAPCEPSDLRRDRRRMVSMGIMQKVLEYLDSSFMQDITLEDAARQANMSLFHFSRFFKSISGMSFTSYLNSVRVHEAEKLLGDTDKPVIDIALECGFTNVRTFNRVFKQITGHIPSDLR